jgi:hypothetical protein
MEYTVVTLDGETIDSAEGIKVRKLVRGMRGWRQTQTGGTGVFLRTHRSKWRRAS